MGHNVWQIKTSFINTKSRWITGKLRENLDNLSHLIKVKFLWNNKCNEVESIWCNVMLVNIYIYIYIYFFYLELPLYNGGAYHQGRSSGASILYKTIMYNKFIAYSL